MDGAAAEHVREASPGVGLLLRRSGHPRLRRRRRDLAADLDDKRFKRHGRLVDKPVINMESAANHPCQALADWKTLDDLGVPRHGPFVLSWVNHPRALPLAVPAPPCTWRRMRGMDVVVLRPEGFALPRPSCRRRRAAAAAGGSVPETTDRDDALNGAHVIYAKEWGSTSHYGNAEADARAARELADWCVRDTWFSRAAVDCQLMHCLPVRRNVAVADEVLDGRAASCSARPTTAWSCRPRCCTACSRPQH